MSRRCDESARVQERVDAGVAGNQPAENFSAPAPLAIAGLLSSAVLSRSERLLAASSLALGPEDPEVPNEEVARILKDLFGNRPIRRGHVQLDMPAVAEDGRVVPVIIESDIPMAGKQYREGRSPHCRP